MAKEKVVVKKLISVEDLGNVDTICTDKTGTLTVGKFSLNGYFNTDGEKDSGVLTKAILCSEGFFSKGMDNVNQVDRSLLLSSVATRIANEIKDKYQILDKNDFDFDRKTMSVVVKNENSLDFIVKGACEEILKDSLFCVFNNNVTTIQIFLFTSEGLIILITSNSINDQAWYVCY